MYAYVTLVMLGDKYAAGALALGQSLIDSGTRHQLVCMVTDDLTSDSLHALRATYHSVVTVPYIKFKCGSMMTQRQKELYDDWIEFSFTKWRVFQLIKYDKVLYLDADHIVAKNIDHLFDLQPPAMCFKNEFNKAYDSYAHGDTISTHDLRYFFKNLTSLAATGTLLLAPSKDIFVNIMAQLNEHNIYLHANQFHNGFEEVVLLQALIALGISVTQISYLYVWNAGCYKNIIKKEPFVINYYGDKKPWASDEILPPRYIDEYIWRYFYSKCKQRIAK